ncbi:MAG: PHB depolymerase family esterase [Gemmatimonadaceae bacterium]
MIPDSPAPPPAVAWAADTSSMTNGEFVWREVATGSVTRRYRLYIPRGYDKKRALPLVVVLHGCTQGADNIARGTRFNAAADVKKIIVAYPEQPASANALRCWNWFEPAHQQRDKGEPASIAAITRQILHDMRIDPARVYIAGVSAGAAMALNVMYTYPELYAALGAHSGIAYGHASSISEGVKAMSTGAGNSQLLGEAAVRAMGDRARPVAAIVFHGRADPVVKVVNGAQVVSQIVAANSITGTRKKGAATAVTPVSHGETSTGYHYDRVVHGKGKSTVEHWTVDELAHAWSGGSPDGTYTDARGPDATAEMIRFFLDHPRR